MALALAAALATGQLHAAPFIPKSDAEIVEHLPAATDPALRRVEAMRRQLAARPDDTALRLEIARRWFDLAMAQGDPRYVGYAQAALQPLQKAPPDDADYWLVRGLLQQYSHDFAGALASLERASTLDPQDAEPVSWRAAIHMVQARLPQARAECDRLAAVAPGLLAQGCMAYARAAGGELRPAYEGLAAEVARATDLDAGLALWLHTRLAEMAIRLQQPAAAERHFKAALATGITDQFLLGAYADFLLQQARPAEVLQLLAGWERSDILLLRLALAGRAAKDARATEWTRLLAERFAAARQRGDRLHEQEAARFALDLQGDAAAALELARRNYADQKEPRDAEILLRAAAAAKQPAAARPALDWLKASGHEDARLARLAQQLESTSR